MYSLYKQNVSIRAIKGHSRHDHSTTNPYTQESTRTGASHD